MVEVFFKDKVLETVAILNQIGKGFEWVGELWGKIVSDLLIVEELLLLKQIVSPIGINTGINNQKRSELRHESLFYHSKAGRLDGNQMVGWIHSHNDMAAFLSETDRSQIEDVYLNEIPFLISSVVSSKSKIYRRRRFGFVNKEKRLPFTLKMWFDGEFKNRKYVWSEEKFKPGKNFSFTVLNDEISNIQVKFVKTEYNKMVEKIVFKKSKTAVPMDHSFLDDYFT